jgi:AcrR family transcriptional regulator
MADGTLSNKRKNGDVVRTSKQSRRIETEERILSAAETRVARKGFDSLGVNMLAAEADVAKHLIYRC